jgi:hypothetical protein
MAEHQAIIALAQLGWSYRRIAAEVGVDRETVSRHVRTARGDPPGSNAAISIAGADVPAVNGAGSADPNATIPITGSGGSVFPTAGPLPTPAGRRSRCEPLRALILAKQEQGLSSQRIWQDLTAEHGFSQSYQSVQRFVRTLRAATPLPFRRMECAPGEEARIDFGRGAPIITADGNLGRSIGR